MDPKITQQWLNHKMKTKAIEKKTIDKKAKRRKTTINMINFYNVLSIHSGILYD